MIGRCDGCDARYTDPRPTNEFLTSLYEGNYEVNTKTRRPELPDWKKKLSWWFRGVTDPAAVLDHLPGGRVLDFGCHDGSTMEEMGVRGMEPHGVDINRNAVESSRRRGFPVHLGSLKNAPWPEDYFDSAFMGYVIEHLPDPAVELRAIHRLMKPGGRMLVSTHNTDSYYRGVFRDRWVGWHVPYHLHHFNRRSLTRLAEDSGFRVARCWSRTPTQWAGMSIRIGIGDRVGRTHNGLYRPLPTWAVIPLSLVNRALDLLLSGDCLLAILKKESK